MAQKTNRANQSVVKHCEDNLHEAEVEANPHVKHVFAAEPTVDKKAVEVTVKRISSAK